MDPSQSPTTGHKRARSATSTPTSENTDRKRRRRNNDNNDGAVKKESALSVPPSDNHSPDPLLTDPTTYTNGAALQSPSKKHARPRGRPPKSAALQPQKQLQHPTQSQQPESISPAHMSQDAVPSPQMSPRKNVPTSPAKSPSRSPAKSPLKSILTPSRHNRGPASERIRKSVVFDVALGEKTPGEVVFEDLPGSAATAASTKRGAKLGTPITAKAGKERTPLSEKLREASKKSRSEPEKPELVVDGDIAPEGEQPEDAAIEKTDESEVCQICDLAESAAHNKILICDVCGLGYHQNCHDVTEVPKGDWLCFNCAQEDVTKTPSTKRYTHLAAEEVAPEIEPAVALLGVPEIVNFEIHLRAYQRVLVDRCTGRRRMKLIGQEEPLEKTRQVIEQTVVAGEGNSMLVIGARGSGKTTMIESVIDDMTNLHADKFHTVRLNGFVHTDDKLALKEIWRQLGVEMEVDEAVMKRTSYADTLASLLALLSHPTEISGAEAEGVTSKSVIFVIDEFDMFAYHPRQTLLYNLFDIAQARKAPIAVIGCTTRLDVVDMLEKRVKSRFSHRYVYMMPPRSLNGYWQMCRQGLLIDDDDAYTEGIDMEIDGFFEFQDFWTDMVGQLHDQETFQKLLKHHYYSSKSVPGFLATCVLPLSLLRPTTLPLRIPAPAPTTTSSSKYSLTQPNAVIAAQSVSAPPSKAHALASLSDLDLSLLIAAARLDIVAHTDTVNFAMAYDEYAALVGKQRIQAGMLALGGGARVWGRGVAGIAWEKLVNAGLLVPASVGGRGQMGGLETKMWKVDMALEDIPVGAKLSAPMAKWCREI